MPAFKRTSSFPPPWLRLAVSRNHMKMVNRNGRNREVLVGDYSKVGKQLSHSGTSRTRTDPCQYILQNFLLLNPDASSHALQKLAANAITNRLSSACNSACRTGTLLDTSEAATDSWCTSPSHVRDRFYYLRAIADHNQQPRHRRCREIIRRLVSPTSSQN